MEAERGQGGLEGSEPSHDREEASGWDTLPPARFPVPQRHQAAYCPCGFCLLLSNRIHEKQPPCLHCKCLPSFHESSDI